MHVSIISSLVQCMVAVIKVKTTETKLILRVFTDFPHKLAPPENYPPYGISRMLITGYWS